MVGAAVFGPIMGSMLVSKRLKEAIFLRQIVLGMMNYCLHFFKV